MYIYIYCIYVSHTHLLHISPINRSAKFSQQYFEVCLLEPLLNCHFINHHLRMPECARA